MSGGCTSATVSLALNGADLGAAWEEQIAIRMVREAAFDDVRIEQVEGDFINNYYTATVG